MIIQVLMRVCLLKKAFKNPLEDNATSRQPFTSRTFHPRN